MALREATCHVVIVGAGLGGLAAAIGIKKAGHEVTVLERMSVLREVGAGIQIPPNAARILKQWGVLEDIESCAVQPDEIVVRSYRDGDVLARQKLAGVMQESYRVPYLVVHRAEFHKVLAREAEDLGVIIRLGAVVEQIDFSKPAVHLEDGDVYEPDMIIGSDGERSFCRDALLGYPNPPHPSGDIVLRITVPTQDVLCHQGLVELVAPPCVNIWLGPGAHVLSYTLMEDGLLNIVLVCADYPGSQVSFGPQKAEISQVRDIFNGWDPKLKALLDIAVEVSKWILVECDDLEAWTHHEGKFALLGDAAHAMLPYIAQGAAQALEDAAVLAELLSKLQKKSQMPDILALYEGLRKPRAMQVKWRSKATKDINSMLDGPLQEERDRQLSHWEPFEGYPNPLADPVFSKWLFNYDVAQEVSGAWNVYAKIKNEN